MLVMPEILRSRLNSGPTQDEFFAIVELEAWKRSEIPLPSIGHPPPDVDAPALSMAVISQA